MDQEDVWFLYIVRRLDSFKKNVYVYDFYKSDDK